MINIIVMNRKRLEGNDSGIVSILVTIIFMVVIGLIIMGFAESSRNQNRQTIDNQLSTGSYYAAQSGINEILTNLKDGAGAFAGNQLSCCPLSSCTTTTGALGFNSTDSSTITCYSYNRIPGNLVYGNVSTSQPTIAHIVPVDSSGNSYTGDYKLTFTWNDNSGNSSSGCDSSFSKTYTKDNYVTGKPCSPGVLRLDLSIDPSSCTGDMRVCLQSNAETIFLTPTSNSTTQTIFPAFSGQINPLILNGVWTGSGSSNSVSITCYSSHSCSYINMRAIYSSSIVKIGITDSSGYPLAFADGQAQIDVTAKTQNVVRRLVATASLTNNSSNVPGFAIQSTDSICKLLVIDNTKGNLSNGVSNLYTSSDPSGLGTTSTDSCWSGYL